MRSPVRCGNGALCWTEHRGSQRASCGRVLARALREERQKHIKQQERVAWHPRAREQQEVGGQGAKARGALSFSFFALSLSLSVSLSLLLLIIKSNMCQGWILAYLLSLYGTYFHDSWFPISPISCFSSSKTFPATLYYLFLKKIWEGGCRDSTYEKMYELFDFSSLVYVIWLGFQFLHFSMMILFLVMAA